MADLSRHASAGSTVDAALRRWGLIPLVDADGPAEVEGLGAALMDGGLPVAEVTLRRPDALGALRALAQSGDLLVGAGTVMTARQAGAAVEAGARFLVSPGFSASVAAEAARLEVALIPGVVTATELMNARDHGFSTVKFFPAAASGGPPAIRALSAVSPTTLWVPTGGIDASTAKTYLDIPSVVAVGGSWMTPRALLQTGAIREIAELVHHAKAILR